MYSNNYNNNNLFPNPYHNIQYGRLNIQVSHMVPLSRVTLVFQFLQSFQF